MKNLGLLISLVFAASIASAYVAEFDKKSVFMAVKLGSGINQDGKQMTHVVAKVQVDPKTNTLKNSAGQLNIVKYLGYINESVVENYLETKDNYPLKNADVLKLHEKVTDYKKHLESSQRIPFASLIVLYSDPRYEISVQLQNDSNPLRTLMMAKQFPIYIERLDLFETSLIKALSEL